jgi:hypothetical protein
LPADSVGDLDGFLRERLEQPMRLAWTSVQQQARAADMNSSVRRDDYAAFAREEPLLALVTLNRANEDQMARGEQPCVSLEEAFDEMKAPACAELANRLARARIALQHPMLQSTAATFSGEQQALDQALTRLSRHLSAPAGPLSTAITFCRLGEMAVISAIQHFCDYGQQVDDDTIARMLQHYASTFGNAIKTQRKLPFLLRELTGALFQLSHHSMRKDRVLMRIAALETGFAHDPEQLIQLRRWIGLSSPIANAD